MTFLPAECIDRPPILRFYPFRRGSALYVSSPNSQHAVQYRAGLHICIPDIPNLPAHEFPHDESISLPYPVLPSIIPSATQPKTKSRCADPAIVILELFLTVYRPVAILPMQSPLIPATNRQKKLFMWRGKKARYRTEFS